MTTATTPYTPAEELQVEFVRRLDAVRDLLPEVQEIPPGERDGWCDDDLAALAWMVETMTERLAQYLPHPAELERHSAQGAPWAELLLLRKAGKPVPDELVRRAREWLDE